MQEKEPRETLCKVCRVLYERELVRGVGGNVSLRSGDQVLITPTGACLGRLDPEEIAETDLQGAPRGPASAGRPSKEINLHLAIYSVRSDARAVLHTHSAASVAVSCLAEDVNNALPPLTPGFLHLAWPLKMVPFRLPGSPELAEAVSRVMASGTAALIRNHGLVVAADSVWLALDIAEEIEECCLVHLLTNCKANPIPQEYVRPYLEARKAEHPCG